MDGLFLLLSTFNSSNLRNFSADSSRMKLSDTLSYLRLFAFLEGCSFLLFALTMPLKYSFDIKWPNQIVGMAHGLLFIIYIVLVWIVSKEKKWSLMTQFWAYLASLLPFGTFVADAKIFKKTSIPE